MARLRLLKVIVQPVFVIDDDEVLIERVADTVVVAAIDWPTYASTVFPTQVQALQSELDL